MAMPQMAGYPQMAARSPSPSRMMHPQPAQLYRHVAPPSPLGMVPATAVPATVPSPLQVVRVPVALSPTQRHFPASVYPNQQVQLSCGSSSPAPPAPVLLRRPSNDGTAPAWKEMQQRLGYSEAPQAASPQVPPPHAAPGTLPGTSPAPPVLLAKPEARACGVKEGKTTPANAGQTCPTPPVPAPSTPVELPWTRLASEALGEDGTLRNPSGGCDEVKREKKAPGERSMSPAPEAKAREAKVPEAKAPAPPRRPSREAKAEDLAWAKPSSTPTSSPTSPNVHARGPRTPGASPTSPATTATSSPRPEKKQPSAEKKATVAATVHERKTPEKAASAKGAIATATRCRDDWNDEKPVESSLSAWKKSQQLLFGRTKTDDEDAAQTFCREMFISRRQGRPEDHYRVLGVLGKGSFGVVRKVQCRQTKAMRVMKIVDKQKALSGGYPLKLIMEEIDKLKSLDHPAVLRLFEYYADSRSLYLITDLLPGGDLLEAVEKSYAERKQLPEGWVAVVFRQACEGVAYCHAKGVMHKDLKLENIMLCSIEPPEAVVIDVGLAELFPPSEAESFKSADAAGTLATMAPEVIRGSFNAKCDVWSLGCCLYALLCTRPRRLRDSPETEPSNEDDGSYYNYFYPFRPPLGESRSELKAYLERQKRGPDLARLRCSAAADDLVKEMLAYEEPSRSQMRQILAHRWLQSRDREQVLGAGQVDSLLQFHRTNALAQAVLLDMASQLPLAQLRELTQLFESMDKDGNGMLDRGELTEALTKAGLQPEQARQAAVRLLRDGGGAVEFSRFVAALVPSCRDLLSAKLLRSSFDRLDENGDGFVSRAELQRLLERAGSKLAQAQQQLAEKDKLLQKASTAHLPGDRGDRVPDSSDDESCPTSGSKRLRAAKAARKAFDNISGEGRVRVSFESLHRLLGGNFS